MRSTKTAIGGIAAALLSLPACTAYSTFGFPTEEGNTGAGAEAFVDHGCNRCHDVAGMTLPLPPGAVSPRVLLGGETSIVKSYSELVTSVINPNHRISERYEEERRRRGLEPRESPMPMTHIDSMTVRQLIDIVAFLDSRYVLVEDYSGIEELLVEE